MAHTWTRRLATLGALIALSACSPRLMLVRSAADQLASQGQATEDDLQLAREASAFYLKLSESVLQQDAGHLGLAASVASGFTQYAYAFVAFEADQLEARDAKAAQALRERAARLYRRAHRHAMAALAQRHSDLRAELARAVPDGGPRLAADEVGVAYWAAASWGALISLSKDDPDTVADLPLAQRLAERAWMQEPGHAQGALASLMGSFEAARPGGSPQRAQAYFDQAIDQAAGRSAGVYVAKAEGLALPAGDRAQFEALLHQAVDAATRHRDLANAVMLQRAQWLLGTADDLF